MSELSLSAVEKIEHVIDRKIQNAFASYKKSNVLHRGVKVLRTDSQGITWVHIPGGAEETPVDLKYSDVEDGDTVTLRFENGFTVLEANTSNPPMSETKAIDKTERAILMATDPLNATLESITAELGAFDKVLARKVETEELEANYAHVTNGVIDNATISYADVNDLNAHYASIENGVITNATIDQADVNNLSSHYASIENGVISNATISYADVDDLNAHYASIENGVISNATISYADVDDLNAHYASIENGVITNATISYANVDGLSANYATVANLNAATGRISTIESNYVSTNYLTSNYIDAQHINADYAEIDFSNVIAQNAAYEKIQDLMIASGWFETTQVGQETVNYLTAVHIDADDVDIEHLKVRDLYLFDDSQGTEGIWYQLNITAGGLTYSNLTPEMQAEVKAGLHGSNIIAATVTADKIYVQDLSAFRATIAGMVFGTVTIGGTEYYTLHTAGKTAVNTDSPGMYTDSMGQFSVGNASNYLMFYKDANNQWQLAISAKQITLDNTTLASRIQTLQDQIDSTVETWFGSGAPTSSTAPEVNWTGQGEKAKHLGDVYYDNDTGYAYRFTLLNDTYGWAVMPDSAVATALDTANSILIYDHTYEIVQSDGTVQGETAGEDVAVFTAHLYQGGVDVAGQQPDYPASQFTWYRKSETPDQNGDTEHYIDSGLTLRVRMEELGYGSHIIGKFTTLEQAALLTDDDEPLTTSDDEPLIVRTPLGDSVRVSDLSVETTLYGTEKIMIVGAGGEHLVTVSTLQEYLDANLTKQIRFGTTSQWAAQTSLVSEAETVYVYTDHSQDRYGNALAGLKVGDGSAYVVDLPFVDAAYAEHVADTNIHVTSQEKAFWNNKVRCYYAGVEQLVFTTN